MKNEMKSQKKENSVIAWIDYRLPIFSFITHHLAQYKTPKNLSFLWNMGSLAGIALVLQILTGIFLAMHYDPNVGNAFNSIEFIMRNVNYGWLIRYMHAVGASTFFMVIYIHIFRGLYYGSYKYPRELLWFIGVIIFLMMMATAFMGYVLPWGQMSFWAATVITNLFSAIPIVGDTVVNWICGGYSIGNPTLNRFFTLHYLIPFLIVGVVLIHLIALHRFGSSNPTGVNIKSDKDTIPFHPYYTIKDVLGISAYLIVFFGIVFYAPNYLGHPDNYIEADPFVTPNHIVPEWYFLPFYAILRSIPNKLAGVCAMFGSILIWFLLPWLDRAETRSGSYRPIFKKCYFLFALNFLILLWIGAQEVKEPFITIGRISVFYYFAYFIIILPILSRYEKTKPLPNSIDESINSMNDIKLKQED